MTKKGSVIWLAVLFFVGTISVVAVYFGYELFKKPVGKTPTEVVFEVPPGSTLTQIANDLQAKRLIRNARAFRYYVQFRQLESKIKVGEYALAADMSPDQIMGVLVSGKSIARSITIAEGLNIFDIATLIEKTGLGTADEFYKLVHDKNFIKEVLGEPVASLEGYLFPETYKYTKYEDLKSLVTQMVTRFKTVWEESLSKQAAQLNWTRHQVVTFASIVEKETGAGFERPKVASVFHNRLVKKMKLQTDPTVLYGMAVTLKKMPNNITRQDLVTPTPYNTYTNFGLPPGPISNPGKEAMLATLNPEKTNYIFFVSQNNGTHVFSENLQDHNKAVQKFQLDAKARQNKSWRDLNK